MRYTLAYIDEHDGWISTFYHTFKDDFDIKKIKVNADSSVDEIITNLFQDKLDAIVTDYLLDEEGDVSFNGNKIVDEIKKTKPHFPIIMLTAYEPEAISQMDEVHIIYEKISWTVKVKMR